MIRRWPHFPARPISCVALEKLHWIIVTLNVRLFHLPKPKTILISLLYTYNAQSQVYEDLKINPLWWKFYCVMVTWFYHKTIGPGDWRCWRWDFPVYFTLSLLEQKAMILGRLVDCGKWELTVSNAPPHRDTKKMSIKRIYLLGDKALCK